MSDKVELANVFGVAIQKSDDADYAYWKITSMWDNVVSALEGIEENRSLGVKGRYAIKHRKMYVTRHNGRVLFEDVLIWEDGKWLDESFDPRASDPEFQEYLRLKEKFKEQ